MEIWELVRRDAECGAERMVAEFGNRLLAAASLICRNDPDAEELVFRTFEQAVKKIRQFKPTGDFYKWLYTIMLNFRRMDLRKQRVELVSVGSPSDLPEAPDPMMVELIAKAEYDSLWQALHRIAAPLREVAVMRYFAERSIEEIAVLLSIPEGTVKSRLHQARADLKAHLSATIKEIIP